MGEEGSTTVQERSVLGAGWLGTRKQPHSSSRESQAKAAPALAPTKPKRNPKKEVSAAVRVCCSDHLSIHAIHAMPFTLFQTQTPYIQRERHTHSLVCTVLPPLQNIATYIRIGLFPVLQIYSTRKYSRIGCYILERILKRWEYYVCLCAMHELPQEKKRELKRKRKRPIYINAPPFMAAGGQ